MAGSDRNHRRHDLGIAWRHRRNPHRSAGSAKSMRRISAFLPRHRRERRPPGIRQIRNPSRGNLDDRLPSSDTDRIGAHALRATGATNALDHQADIAKVQEWLGHDNIATTRIYDHPPRVAPLSPLYRRQVEHHPCRQRSQPQSNLRASSPTTDAPPRPPRHSVDLPPRVQAHNRGPEPAVESCGPTRNVIANRPGPPSLFRELLVLARAARGEVQKAQAAPTSASTEGKSA